MTTLDDYLARRAELDARITAEPSAARKHNLRRELARVDAAINLIQTRMQREATTVRIERYCTCGAVLKVDVERRRKQQALIVWYNEHDGAGHGDTDAAGAEAARMGTNTGMGRESARLSKRG